MNAAVEAMVAQAVALIGTGETNGNNVNIVTEWFGENGAPWCDMTVTYCAYHSGNQAAVCFDHYHDNTVEHAHSFRDRGQWHTDVAGIDRGDIVFFDWAGSNNIDAIDHVGLVEFVDSGGVHTIEGNIDNVCKRMVRHSDFIVGYGRPSYAADAPAPVPAPTPEPAPAPDPVPTPPPPPAPKPVLPFASYKQIHAAALLSSGISGSPHASDNSKPSVLLYQKGLARLVGLDYSGGPGTFGPRTHAATLKFQQLQGWTGKDADGVPGPVTTTLVAAKSGVFHVDDL